jgi:N-acetylmuramoyl-L-alanine amidase
MEMTSLLFASALGLTMPQVYSGVPQPWVEPGFGNIVWVDSPNFNDRPEGTIVDTVVVHHTANDSLEGTAKWFFTPDSKVSSHYTIGKDGSIVQHVSTFKRAWHAGASKDVEGRENVNHFSIGIELVNLGDGKHPYPEAQTTALRYLIDTLKRRFPLKYITSHKFIALPAGRKPDPINFPWDTLEGLGLRIVP